MNRSRDTSTCGDLSEPSGWAEIPVRPPSPEEMKAISKAAMKAALIFLYLVAIMCLPKDF